MQVPLELSFRGVDHAPEIEADVRSKAAGLEEFCSRMTACRVVIEAPHHHHRRGNLYHVRIFLAVPGTELVVDREPREHHAHENLHVAIRDAFDSARRQLQDYVRRLQGAVKTHEAPPHGRVARVFPAQGYGFITTPDGREVYFHANSLLDAELAELAVGAEVRFIEEPGDKGPQATSVRLAARQHPRSES